MSTDRRKRLIGKFRSASKAIELVCRIVGLTFIIAGWLGELAIMLTRNVVSIEPGWTVELVTLALVYGSLLYVGLVTRHIGFTLISKRLERNRYLSRFVPLISLVIVGALFVYAIQSVITARTDGGTAIETPGFNYPNWLVVVVIPVMLFTLFVQLLYKFFRPTAKSNQDKIIG